MRRTAIVFIIVLCLSTSNAQADLTLNNGETHNIDTDYPDNPISGDLDVSDGPGSTTTTVNLLTGGSVELVLDAHDSSLVNIDGGSIGQLLIVHDSSLVNIYSGSIGATGPPTTGILTWNSSTVNIYGGSMPGWLRTDNSSTVNIYGGSITGDLNAFYNSTVNIYGVGFNYSCGPISDMSGNLTGTLYMGDSLSMDFVREPDGASIILHEMAVIPAPGAALLGTLGLISASWRLRKRRIA